jgi:hypothetical protein
MMRRTLHQEKAATKNLDKYLDVELTNTHCSLRSFALGGLPYFEESRPLADPATHKLVGDVIAGRLTDAVLELFDGIDLGSPRGLPCFITDRRRTIATESTVTLVPPELPDPGFRVIHARSCSQDAILTDLFDGRSDDCEPIAKGSHNFDRDFSELGDV